MQPASYAAGVRRRYQDLPTEVRQWVDTQLGAPVARVRNAQGGFSPGVAAVVTSIAGDDLFVKAVGGAVNAEALRFYRLEREVAAVLPRLDGVLAPTAWTDLEVAGESFAVMVFPALEGATPAHPWRPVDVRRTLDALARISEQLTPSPWPSTPGDQRLPGFFHGWESIAADPDARWRRDAWVFERLPALVEAEALLRTELPGQTLSHIDLRADNIILSPDRVWFVDWAHAQNAAAWVDAAILIGDVVGSGADRADGGKVDVAGAIRSHPLLNRVSFGTVWRLLVALAGAMHAMSSRPDPPGLPTIRSWQAATGDTLLQWCRREAPVGWPD